MTKLIFSSSFITTLIMCVNFLFKIYISHIYAKNALGIYYTFLDIVSLGVTFLSGFKDSLIVAFDRFNKNEVFYVYLVSFITASSIVFMVDTVYFIQLKFSFPIILFFMLFVLNLAMIFFSYLNSALKNYKVMLFESLVMSMGYIFSFVIFYFFIKNIYALIYAIAFSYIMRILYLLFFKRESLKLKITNLTEYKVFFINTLLSSLMYFFSGLFVSMSGIVIWKLFHDTSLLSEYQVVVRSIFFSLVAIFVFPLNSMLFPQISALIAGRQFNEIQRIEKKMFRYMMLFWSLLIILLFLMKYIIIILFPPSYNHSYIYINYMLMFLPLIAYTTFALNIIKAFNRFDFALYVRLFGSLIFFISIGIFYFAGFSAKFIFVSFDLAFASMAMMSFYYKKRLLK